MDSGIYKIANKVTGDLYIGSTVNFQKRFSSHRRNLEKQKHSNIILQNVFNKYGHVNLVFEIIEFIKNKNSLITREQHYIDILNPKYNIRKIASSNLGLKFGPMSLETKKKISLANAGNKNWLEKSHTENTKKLLSKLNSGKNNPRYGVLVKKETKTKMSKAKSGKNNPFYGKNHTKENILKKSKPYKIKSPEGLIIEGINLAKFCREHNLSNGHIHNVINGKRNHHKGWTKA